MIRKLLAQAGPLRCALFGATLLLVIAAPFAGGEVVTADWRILPSVIAPVFMVFLVFVYPLDMTMTRVFMLNKRGPARQRYVNILRTEGLLYVLLLGAWTPFIWQLVDA